MASMVRAQLSPAAASSDACSLDATAVSRAANKGDGCSSTDARLSGTEAHLSRACSLALICPLSLQSDDYKSPASVKHARTRRHRSRVVAETVALTRAPLSRALLAVLPALLLPRAPRATRSPLRISHYSYGDESNRQQRREASSDSTRESCLHPRSLSFECACCCLLCRCKTSSSRWSERAVDSESRDALSRSQSIACSLVSVCSSRSRVQQTRFQTMSNAIIGRSQHCSSAVRAESSPE